MHWWVSSLILSSFEFRLRITLASDGSLSLISRIRNINGKQFSFSFAYHTYFSVSDIRYVIPFLFFCNCAAIRPSYLFAPMSLLKVSASYIIKVYFPSSSASLVESYFFYDSFSHFLNNFFSFNCPSPIREELSLLWWTSCLSTFLLMLEAWMSLSHPDIFILFFSKNFVVVQIPEKKTAILFYIIIILCVAQWFNDLCPSQYLRLLHEILSTVK